VADYDGLEPLLVAPLKASLVFLADLSRATPILHTWTSSSSRPTTATLAARSRPACGF
jgi:hypoxanthine-guanine phosphoribosyltransferase